MESHVFQSLSTSQRKAYWADNVKLRKRVDSLSAGDIVAAMNGDMLVYCSRVPRHEWLHVFLSEIGGMPDLYGDSAEVVPLIG